MRHFKHLSALLRDYRLLFVAAIVAGLIIAAGIIIRTTMRENRQKESTFNVESVLPQAPRQNTQQETFSQKELAKYNGQNGAKCYVAIDRTVYEIAQGRLWKDGQHTTSQGQAMCGRDLTQAIKRSPHGRSKLTSLPTVGTLEEEI